jgi:hypothetical protein
MKKIITLLFAIVALAAQTGLEPVTLAWDYPAAELKGTAFNIYHSQDPALPLNQWQKVASVQETNLCRLSIVPGAHFFTATASNFWGESQFSNIASTPAVPRSDGNLRIRRGD